MTLFPAALAALILAAAPQSLKGQQLLNALFDRFEQQIGQQYSVTPVMEVSDNQRLPQGEFHQLDFTLEEEGGAYIMVGVCDEYCSDMDLAVVSSDGQVVGQDLADDDSPIIVFTGRANLRYRALVSIPRCSADRCLAGARIYRMD